VASLLLGIAACSGPGERPPGFSVEDSAGVALARNTGTGTRWLGLEETLRIGEADGPPARRLHRVGGVYPGPEGTLLVVNDLAAVRVYGPDGALLRELGGRGPGPGRFQVLTQAVPVDGGVLATDLGLRRLTRLTREGDVVWTTGWPEEGGSGVGLVRVGDRVLLETRRAPEGLEPGALGRVTGEYWEIGLESGQLTGPVLSLPAGTAMRVSGGLHPPPLLDTTDVHRVAGPDRVVGAVGDGYAVEVRAWSGELLRRVTRDFDPVPVTREDLRRFDEAVERAPGGPTERAVLEAARPRVAHVPPVELVIPVQEGGFWVQRRDLARDPFGNALARRTEGDGAGPLEGRVFEYFDDVGRYVGSVRLPDRFAPRHWTARHVVGVLRDEADVEHVVRLRLVSGEG
jgi:hypothetical protein